ncbi:MAG: hypothetical protein JST17_11775 [Bacteroidetes bacterium]|nr:hypothetical protein [Bacteroidota bacterium]MBS1930099.1 hypothetical protein [Bacteroidota bacterium]
MKKQTLFFILATGIFLSSCKIFSTLYPLSENDNDFIFKKELIGKWEGAKDTTGDCTIDTVAGSGGKLYTAGLTDLDKNNITHTQWFLCRLIKVNQWYFLDCGLDMNRSTSLKGDDYNDLLITKHFIFSISFLEKDRLEISSPDSDEFIKLINQKKIKLDYTELKKDDFLILNEPTQLKKGFSESKKYPLVYKDKTVLVRSE